MKRSEMRLTTKALRQGWQVTDETIKAAEVEALEAVLTGSDRERQTAQSLLDEIKLHRAKTSQAAQADS